MITNHVVPSAGSRREILKSSAETVAATSLLSALAPPVHAANSDTLKVALIGCGSRGAGAAVQALSTSGPVKLWAMADAFSDRLENCLRNVERELDGEPTGRRASRRARRNAGGATGKIDVPKDRQFVGLDAYRKAIDSGVDLVLLAEPPGYRPKHFEAIDRNTSSMRFAPASTCLWRNLSPAIRLVSAACLPRPRKQKRRI
jgi:myo-inositol 2-dehydrogenase/D-chiro-inositol 1-dehydrogenase